MTYKNFHSVALLLMLLIGCSYNGVEPVLPTSLPAEPEIPSYTKAINIEVKQVKELKVLVASPENQMPELIWKANGGSIIKNNGAAILFQAPDYPDNITVKCELKKEGKIQSIYTFLINAYHQVVVLKADDLVYVSGTVFPENWNKYFNLLDSMGIKGSAGIIGNSLENAPKEYYDKIRFYHQKGLVEFWNHGYTHELKGINSRGELYHEFYNRDLQDQEKNLKRTQDLGRKNLGITFRAFGAPGNGIDDNTRIMIDQNEDIRVWFYGDTRSNKSILNRTNCEIEFPVHHPSYSRFLETYSGEHPYLTLQFHPTRWSKKEFDDFRKIITFLQTKNVAFMNPTEMASLYFPELVQDIEEVNSVQ